MRRIALLIAPLAVLGLLVAACGDDSSTVSSDGSTTSSSSTSTSTTDGSTTTTLADGGGGAPTTAHPTPPTAADGTVAIEVSVGGGFSPQGLDFSAVPTIVLADGRSFTGGAQTMQYPGPALSPVTTGRLSPAAVDRLLAAARSAGLDGRLSDFGSPGVTDLPSTTVRVRIDGRVHTTSVYALDYDSSGNGVDARQQANRQEVATFVAEVGDAVTKVASAPLNPEGYEVLGFEVDSASAHEGQPAPNDLDWPFADLPLSGSTCARLTGPRAATFTALLRHASSTTVWHAGGTAYHLSIRATLPGRTDCP